MAEDKTAVHKISDLLGEAKRVNNAYLIIISAKTAATIGKMLKLEKGEFVMGRAPDTQLQVEDDGISRTAPVRVLRRISRRAQGYRDP